MALTPSRVRQDLKCGKGSISAGETCHKGPATAPAAAQPTNPKPRGRRKGEGTPLEKALVVGGALGAVGSWGYGLHQLSKGNFERASAASTAAGGFASISGVGVNLAGRRLKNKELAAVGNRIIVAGGLNAAMNGMDWRHERTQRKEREQRAAKFKETMNAAAEAARKRAEQQRDYWRQRQQEYARGNNGQGYRRPPGANGAVPDYLGILGINSSAGAATAKRAWRNLAAQHHPDRGGDPEKAKLINAAYQEFRRRRGDSIWAEGFEPRTDAGVKCGGGYIASGKKCKAGAGGAPTGKPAGRPRGGKTMEKAGNALLQAAHVKRAQDQFNFSRTPAQQRAHEIAANTMSAAGSVMRSQGQGRRTAARRSARAAVGSAGRNLLLRALS